MAEIKSYKDLIVWQKSINLVTETYAATKKFPIEERFGITSQINRASISIPANIAEGWGRETAKNNLQFLRIARGSLMELQTLLIIAANLKFIPREQSSSLTEKTEEVGRILHGFIKSIKAKLKAKELI